MLFSNSAAACSLARSLSISRALCSLGDYKFHRAHVVVQRVPCVVQGAMVDTNVAQIACARQPPHTSRLSDSGAASLSSAKEAGQPERCSRQRLAQDIFVSQHHHGERVNVEKHDQRAQTERRSRKFRLLHTIDQKRIGNKTKKTTNTRVSSRRVHYASPFFRMCFSICRFQN